MISDIGGKPDITSDLYKGLHLVAQSLCQPLKMILSNSGETTHDIFDTVYAGTDNFGYNAKAEVFGDMLVQGVLDPVKVCKVALENAASVASMYLITECVIVNADDIQPQQNQRQ